MKSFTALLLTLILAISVQAQRPGGPGGGDRPEPSPEQQALIDQIRQIKADIHAALIAASTEYADLAALESPTFEDRRRMAELRHELVPTEAIELTETLRDLTGQLNDLRPERPPRPDRPERPELTEEQLAAIEAHKAAVKAAHDALNDILVAADATGRYAALLAVEEPTRAERQELNELRRQLIEGSDEAQTQIDAIKALNEQFRTDNPDLRPSPRRVARHLRHEVRQDIAEVRDLNDQLNALLAADSVEYAELIAKEDKTPEDRERIGELRAELIAANEDAQAVADQIQDARQEVRQDVRRLRHVRDHVNGPRPGPVDRTDDGDTGGTE